MKKRLRAKSTKKGNLAIKMRRSVTVTRMLMKIIRRMETTHQSKALQTKMRQSEANGAKSHDKVTDTQGKPKRKIGCESSN